MHVCPLCRRPNPSEAVFCHFDGIQLCPLPGGRDLRSYTLLPHEFYFPSGHCCRTYDDLIQGCQEEWALASDLLRRGVFAQFLTSVGRLDLARAAVAALGQRDPDIALETFLSSLPSHLSRAPRLAVDPPDLVLGTLAAGEVRTVEVTVSNKGQGLLHGVLRVSEGHSWLQVTIPVEGREPASAAFATPAEIAIKTPHQQRIELRIDTRRLSEQMYRGRLTLITNGGNADVPVTLHVSVQAFASPPFQGARSPRELAERMVGWPREAVPLLESGDVARWFERNGWAYPVSGPQAPGMAAVQQFFEALGLSRPPAVQLSEGDVYFDCASPEVVQGQFRLVSADKKWIYAHADTGVVWLRIQTPVVCGAQKATVSFEVDSSLLEPGRSYEAAVRVVANAGQTLVGRVHVDVLRQQDPLTRRLFRPFALD